jgi:succinate-acetate transporter protein
MSSASSSSYPQLQSPPELQPPLQPLYLQLSPEQLALVLGALAPAPRAPRSDPGPLGLAAFALTTFCLSVCNTGVFLDPAASAVVLPLALFYGGLAQFLAGMWEFTRNNTFGATVFTSYGAFWMSFAAYVYLIVPHLAAAGVEARQPTGLFLLAWLIFSSYMAVAALRVSTIVTAIFATLVLALLLLTIGEFAPSVGCTHAGGWVGIACAFCAWYASAAASINTTYDAHILPTGAHVHAEHAAAVAAGTKAPEKMHWRAAMLSSASAALSAPAAPTALDVAASSPTPKASAAAAAATFVAALP